MRLPAQDSSYFKQHFRLLPLPVRIELLNGPGFSWTELKGIRLVNTSERPVMEEILTHLPLVSINGPGILSLVLKQDSSFPSPEAYTLRIVNGQISVEAMAGSGLFYGLQTFSQLLDDARDQQISIPYCNITDYPKIAYRAVHLDLKHHVDVGSYYYHIIDELAKIKINALIIEFEDKLRYRRAPLVGSGDAISIEEFKAISKYATERNIEITPLVQGLGHASFILKHEAYKKLRDDPNSDWVFDPLNPQTYDLQRSLYEDAVDATPYSKYIHIGGDEVGALGKSLLSRKSGMSPIELQLYWLKKVTEIAHELHRIPIFWDDMVFKLAGLYETTYDSSVGEQKTKDLWKTNQQLLDKKIGLFPKDCMYMRWNYDDAGLPGNIRAIDWYKSKKLPVMAATAAEQVWPMLPRNQSNFQPIKDYCRICSEKNMDGILCTAWDDCSPHFETIWRGLYDFALFSWNFTDIDVNTAHETFRHRFYGPGLNSMDFQDSLENAMSFWETALIAGGDRFNYHENFRLIDLPVTGEPGVWSEKYENKISGASKAVLQYDQIKMKIAACSQMARRNHYALSVMNEINELQVYPAQLLLLLEKYDRSAGKDKDTAAISIKKFVKGFTALRQNFEKVFSQTRIMGNPPGWLPDSNFHKHLANGTSNTDWMFVYELAMNKKIMEWK